MISVVIPVMDSEEITRHLFEQISQNTFLPAEIFLIDNGTDHKFFKFYKFHKIFPKLKSPSAASIRMAGPPTSPPAETAIRATAGTAS